MVTRNMTEARGTRRLEDVGHIDEEAQARLRALSISTVEELEGVFRAAPNALSRAVPGVPFDRLFDDHREQLASFRFRAGGQDVSEVAFGALPPPGIELPTVIPEEWFEEYLVRAGNRPAQLPPPGGAIPGVAPAPGEPGGVQAVDPAMVNLTGTLGPVRRQGRRWTCVAHSIGALLEYRLRSENLGVSLSPQFLYWAAKQVDGDSEGRGTWIEFCLREAAIRGAPNEATWPYNPEDIPGNESQGPPPQAAVGEAGQQLAPPMREVGSRNGRFGLTTQQIVDELASGSPVAFSVATPDAIWVHDDQVRQTGFVTMPLPGTEVHSAHAILAVGYGEDPDIAGGIYLIFRNSWGAEWAPDNPFGTGYGVMPLAYVAEWGIEAFTC